LKIGAGKASKVANELFRVRKTRLWSSLSKTPCNTWTLSFKTERDFKYHQSRVFYLKYLFVKFDQIVFIRHKCSGNIKGNLYISARKLFYGKPWRF
jgi:hypothetical protein